MARPSAKHTTCPNRLLIVGASSKSARVKQRAQVRGKACANRRHCIVWKAVTSVFRVAKGQAAEGSCDASSALGIFARWGNHCKQSFGLRSASQTNARVTTVS